MKNGVQAQPFDVAEIDMGKLAMALVDAGTLLVGTPTVLGGPHPAAAYAAVLANALRPKAKVLGVFWLLSVGRQSSRGPLPDFCPMSGQMYWIRYT